MAIKRFVYPVLLVFLLTACSSAFAYPYSTSVEPTAAGTIQPGTSARLPPPHPAVSATPGSTELFITQVMSTKYAARTAYAALPTQTSTPTIPPGSPNCNPSDLQASFNLQGATQNIAISILVTNLGTKPCFLPSWPVIQLTDPSGNPVDVIYEYIQINQNPSSFPPTQAISPGEPVLYGLSSGQSASLILSWGNWCDEPIPGGVVVHMSLLDGAGALDVPMGDGGGVYCNDPSSPSVVAVMGFGY